MLLSSKAKRIPSFIVAMESKNSPESVWLELIEKVKSRLYSESEDSLPQIIERSGSALITLRTMSGTCWRFSRGVW